MRFDFVGAFTLIALGIFLAVIGMVWHEAYNTEHHLTVDEVIRGRHLTWVAPGPKMAEVTGIALRSQPERITERSETRRGAVTQERVYFPLRMPNGNQAILVSMPFKDFDDRILLSDSADQQMTFKGVLRKTPETTNGQKIEQLFRGVTFPARTCLFVGETAGLREAQWLAVCGVALAISGAGLIALRRARGSTGKVEAPAANSAAPAPETASRDRAHAAPQRAEERGPGSEAPADAIAAMAAVVQGLGPPVQEPDVQPAAGETQPLAHEERAQATGNGEGEDDDHGG